VLFGTHRKPIYLAPIYVETENHFSGFAIVRRQLEKLPFIEGKLTLGPKCLLIFLPGHFEVVGLLFLTSGFSHGSFLPFVYGAVLDG